MKFKNIPSLSRIFASLFRTPKKEAKDWGAQFGYAPASLRDLAEWNDSLTDRAARRRAQRAEAQAKRANHAAHIANAVRLGAYDMAVHQRALLKAVWKGGF